MTFLELRELTVRLMRLAGYEKALPEPDVAANVNFALLEFTTDAECIVSQTTITGGTVIGQAEYTIDRPHYKTIESVIYNTGNSARALDKSSDGDERLGDAAWMMRASGTPERWIHEGGNIIRLVPAPNVASVVLTVRGLRAAADLSADSDRPAFHERFHRGIAYRAAVIFAEEFSETEINFLRIDRYNAQADKLAKALRNVVASEQNQSFQRNVRRRPAYRVSL